MSRHVTAVGVLLWAGVAAWFLVGPCVARQAKPENPEDPILKKLEDAKAKHAKAVEEANKKLLAAIDERAKAAADRGDLKAVTQIKEVRAAAEAGEKFPENVKDAVLTNAFTQRDRTVTLANTALTRSYEDAVRDLTKARKFDEAKVVQAEAEAFGSGSAAAGPSARDKLGGRNRLPAYLLAPDAAYNAKDGLRFKDNSYVRTRDSSFLKQDFLFEMLFTTEHGAEKNKIVIIGLGEGIPATTGYNEPINSVFFRIHPPDFGQGEVRLAKLKLGEVIPTEDKIGEIRENGTHLARIEKKGNVVTFSVCVNYQGKFSADLSRTIPDVKTFAPFLTEKNTRLFFGGGGGFKEVRLTKGK